MNKLLFVGPLLALLSRGGFFVRALAMALRVLAALIVLFSLTTFFHAGRLLFELPVHAILGGVFFEIFLVLAVYASVHVLLIRSRHIESLGDGDHAALRAAPLLFRLAGELYTAFVGLMAIGGGIFVWFTGMSQNKILNSFLRTLFPTVRDNPTFMSGMEFMLSGLLMSVAVLVVTYLFADLVEVWSKRAGEAVPAANGQRSVDPYKTRFGS
jgi:hypothetical protein